MNHDELLRLWKLDEIPACDRGMELAQRFLICAGEGINNLGVEAPEDRMTILSQAYMELVNHGISCGNCNEADELPVRDDVPSDPGEEEDVYLADREVGFQAGLEGQPLSGDETAGWRRGWADAQE